MPRRKTAAAAATDTADATFENAPLREPAAVTAAQEPRQTAKETVASTAYPADPNPKINVSLSDYRGGPSMQLLRSHKFHQMQIRFDGQQPDEKHLARLAELGWKDRTEAEGVWTKQIDRERRWQSVQQMEQEFKAVANAIRQEKGLEPVLEGLAVA